MPNPPSQTVDAMQAASELHRWRLQHEAALQRKIREVGAAAVLDPEEIAVVLGVPVEQVHRILGLPPIAESRVATVSLWH